MNQPLHRRRGFLALRRSFLVLAVVVATLTAAGCRGADPEPDVTPEPEPTPERPSFVPDPRPSGLVANAGEAVAPGYLMFSPISSGITYLIDREGRAVHTWESAYAPHPTYLLDDGSLLRPGRDPEISRFQVGGALGIVQKLSWEGDVVWEWKLSTDQRILHHDVEPLPNGNVLAIGWEVKTTEEAAAAGRRPDLIPKGEKPQNVGLWPDFVIEIEPLPPDGARIVWEWRVWDHLIQNLDPALPNYGDPAAHPGRIDINAGGPPLVIDEEELEQLKALGYVPEDDDPKITAPATAAAGGPAASAGGDPEAEKKEEEKPPQRADFLHINAIDWNPVLDQILLTVPELGEIWVLARPRSTEEAAGPAGDLLYRWGNPAAYGRGAPTDKKLFYPHDAQWVPAGIAGAGNITIFNNGNRRPEGQWSSLVEIVPPLGPRGRYPIDAGGPWSPPAEAWTWSAAERESFYSPFISGVHRQANGSAFVTAGPQGRMFEVAANGEVVWDYWNPYLGELKDKDGKRPWGLGGPLSFAVWRAGKVRPDHPGLAGRDLAPLDPQPAVAPPETSKTPTDD